MDFLSGSAKLYLDIFISFLKPGVMTFGGGPSTIPLLQSEVVDYRGWLTMQEFTDSLALGNTLPGPIATKMSAVIGYKVGGWPGAIVSTLAIVLPTFFAVILLMNIYLKYRESQWLKGMMTAVRPVVVILIAQTVLLMAKGSFPGPLSYIIAALTAFCLLVLEINPAILIAISLVYGGLFIRS